MEEKVLRCGNCKARTPHRLVASISIVSRYRTMTSRIYQCKCKQLKFTKYEKQNKKPFIWD